MKIKRLIASTLISTSLFATQQIQTFTSKNIDIPLDKSVKTEKLFSGTFEEYAKEYNVIFSDDKLKNIGIQTAYGVGMMSATILAYSKMNLNGFKSDGGLVGLAIVLVAGAVMAGKEMIVRDHEYEYLCVLTNASGQKTILQTHIVANEELSKDELELLGSETQKKFIQKEI